MAIENLVDNCIKKITDEEVIHSAVSLYFAINNDDSISINDIGLCEDLELELQKRGYEPIYSVSYVKINDGEDTEEEQESEI